jgi:putative (di)nucleoside polyphosphate hydrolase
MKNDLELPLRTGVGIILLNQENKVFVGKRIDNPADFWQMPQGGVDKNENFLQAAKRELKEETGIRSIKVIKELEGWLQYNLPKHLLGKVWKGKYRGQKQKWFIMKFIGENDEVNVNTKNPEFLDWKWIQISKLPSVAVSFKVDIYKELKEELNSLNFN